VIIADTSVWIDHFRNSNERLSALASTGEVLMHPLVLGELAVGSLKNRGAVLARLRDLTPALVASDDEVMNMIEINVLWGLGLGYIDACLLASARLTDCGLWTHDKRLTGVATKLRVSDRLH
jgi:predicted nucleic acid-binding protein